MNKKNIHTTGNSEEEIKEEQSTSKNEAPVTSEASKKPKKRPQSFEEGWKEFTRYLGPDWQGLNAGEFIFKPLSEVLETPYIKAAIEKVPMLKAAFVAVYDSLYGESAKQWKGKALKAFQKELRIRLEKAGIYENNSLITVNINKEDI